MINRIELKFAQLTALMPTSLDDPTWFRPTADVRTASAQPWDVMDPRMPRFSGNALRV